MSNVKRRAYLAIAAGGILVAAGVIRHSINHTVYIPNDLKAAIQQTQRPKNVMLKILKSENNGKDIFLTIETNIDLSDVSGPKQAYRRILDINFYDNRNGSASVGASPRNPGNVYEDAISYEKSQGEDSSSSIVSPAPGKFTSVQRKKLFQAAGAQDKYFEKLGDRYMKICVESHRIRQQNKKWWQQLIQRIAP